MPRKARFADQDHEPDGVVALALAVVARRPVDAFAGALAAACTLMIFVNALALQQGRGPVSAAPHVNASPAPAQRTESPKRSDLVVQVQTALAERNLYAGIVDGLMGGATAAAIRSFEQSQGLAPTGEASEKVLAALLIAPARKAESATPPRAQGAGSKQATPATTGSTASDPKLMAAQKALAKIGYGPMSIDGKMGAATRNAIRSFERDLGMPESGEPSPQVLRALQAMTGAPLQ